MANVQDQAKVQMYQHLVTSSSQTYRDNMISAMTPEERDQFYEYARNRLQEETATKKKTKKKFIKILIYVVVGWIVGFSCYNYFINCNGVANRLLAISSPIYCDGIAYTSASELADHLKTNHIKWSFKFFAFDIDISGVSIFRFTK